MFFSAFNTIYNNAFFFAYKTKFNNAKFNNAKFNNTKFDNIKFDNTKFNNTKQTNKLLCHPDECNGVLLNFKRRSSLTYLGALGIIFYVAYLLTAHENNATHAIHSFTNLFHQSVMNNALKNAS
jgi:hypothetical protein